MLRFNTYRSKRYLRTKFVEGSYLLASEGTDLELELLDQMRRETQAQFGDVAINDAWKVERLNATQVLIKPGDAFFKGLPYSLRSGNDQLVTGAILSMGTVPVGVVAADDASGLGKIITFNDAVSTPTNLYKFVVTATEELITEVEDPFLKNSNLTEATGQKIRLVYKLNVVPSSLQTESPIPYRDENSASLSVTNFPSTGSFAAPNFVNQTVVTPTAAGNGELLSLVTLSGSAGIDGRDIEIVLRNDSGIGGGIVLPNNPTAQQFYFNGKLIDSNGNAYHINAIFNDIVSTQVVLRLDKEPNQPNPVITNTKPFTIVKRDVFVTDDTNGSPQGKLHWPIANIDFNSGSGILHQSKIVDLRNSIEQVLFNQKSLNRRVNVVPVNSGNISFTLATSTIVTSAVTRLFNGINVADTLNATSYVLKNDSCLAFDLKYDGSILNKGNLAITIASVAGNDATLSSVDLSNVKLGNLVKDSTNAVFHITAIDNVNDIITLNGPPATGASTIYLDSFQEGYVKDDSHTYIFAVRNSNKIYIADLELEDGEISQIGDGVSQQLLTFIGATGESDSSPNYSSEQFITDGDSLVTAIGKLDAGLNSHVTDTVDAHDASAISNTPSGNLAATDVQAALDELQGDIDTNTSDIATNALNILRSGGTETITSTGGTTVLIATDRRFNRLTGTLNHTFDLPSTATLQIGNDWAFLNRSTGDLTVRDFSGTILFVLAPNEIGFASVLLTGSETWVIHTQPTIIHQTVAIANNQIVAANITGMIIPGSPRFRSFSIKYWVDRSASSAEIAESGEINGVYRTSPALWQLSIGNIAGDADIDFFIDSSGQISYTTGNLVGTEYVGNIRWQVTSLIRV